MGLAESLRLIIKPLSPMFEMPIIPQILENHKCKTYQPAHYQKFDRIFFKKRSG